MTKLVSALLTCSLFLSACAKEEPKTSEQTSQSQSATQKSGSALATEAKEKLSEAKGKLAEEGDYNCCLKEPCNMCALEAGNCDCYKDLKKGDHVCTECYVGWQQGKGADGKFKKEDVKTSLTERKQ